MPPATGKLNAAGTTPTVAVIVMGAVVAGLTLLGDVNLTWSFSAVTVLLYYSLTNLSALRLTNDERLFPRWVAMAGLAACFFLTFWVSVRIYAVVVILLVVGLAWKFTMNRLFAN